MKTLGIDTSTMTAGVGIVEDGEILVDLKFDVRVTYSEILMPTIDLAFRTVGMKIDDLDGLAISIGPGSFTGLRIGLSTVKGELKRESEYMAVSVEDLVEKISKKTLFVGPGARLYQKELTGLLGEKACFALNDQSTPSGACIARMGMSKLARGETEDVANLEPLYIRMSEAELKFKNADRT
jgi:tRNA threonylcarbamoyladenosine biosynthesis protein TsaB